MCKMFLLNRASYVVLLFRFCQYAKQHHWKLFPILHYRYKLLCDHYSVYLPIDTTIGKGLVFPHNFPTVINPSATIGENCIIHPCTLIGRDRGKQGGPKIGNHCFIGHGAKIIGNPNIGDWCFISPGAIITKDIPSESLVGAGVNNILSAEGREHALLYQ